MADQVALDVVAEGVVILQHGVGRADNRRQRRAQVVRDGAQQVCLHPLLFGLRLDAPLPLDLLGQHADDQRHGQHRQKRERIAGDREIDLKIRIGEREVDADDGDDRGNEAVKIAVRQPRDDEHGEHEDQRHSAVAVADRVHHQQAHERCGAQQQQRQSEVAQDLPPALTARHHDLPHPGEHAPGSAFHIFQSMMHPSVSFPRGAERCKPRPLRYYSMQTYQKPVKIQRPAAERVY